MTAVLHGFKAAASSAGDTIVYKKIKEVPLRSKIFTPPLVIKTSPTAILWGAMIPPFTAEYRLTAEITSGKRQSEQLSISILGKNLFLKLYEKLTATPPIYQFKVSGWRIQYAHKFYLVGKRRYAPYGFYAAPLISYTNAHVATDLKRHFSQTYFEFRHFSINGIIGVQAGKKDRLTIDIYCGLGYKTNKIYYHADSFRINSYDSKDLGPLYNSHLSGVFGVSLGYSL
jgi:hypothetical protein